MFSVPLWFPALVAFIVNRFYRSLCAITLLLAVSCGPPYQEPVAFKVTPGKPDARLTVEAAPEKAVIQVYSDSGIGSAEVEVTAGPVPKTILLRFHLRGLEELRFAYGNVTVMGSIASTKAGGIRQSLRGLGDIPAKEQAISTESQYWLKMRVVSQTDIPIQDGYIEVEAPPNFANGGHRKFAIQWIDFYR